MSKKFRSVWSDDVQYGEIYQEHCKIKNPEELLENAYGAIANFCHKEIRRSKQEKRKPCWQ